MSSDEWPRGTKFVSCEFDQTIMGRHPKTGEALPPPLSGTFVCTPETIGMMRATFVWLANKYGWKVKLHESFVYREDQEEEADASRNQGVDA